MNMRDIGWIRKNRMLVNCVSNIPLPLSSSICLMCHESKLMPNSGCHSPSIVSFLQNQHDELETKFFEERAVLEAKYQKLYEPLYTKVLFKEPLMLYDFLVYLTSGGKNSG